MAPSPPHDPPASPGPHRDDADRPEAPGEPLSSTGPLETTAHLLARVRDGDAVARERLFARVLPRLTRWAHRRLPRGARDLADTDDMVQATLGRALAHVERFEPRGGEGAFLAYLRTILMNLVRDEMRRTRGRRPPEELSESFEDPAPSPLERTVSRGAIERYERALGKLDDETAQAVILRVEFEYAYAEIAEALGLASADAARMRVGRAMVDLARRMRDE